MQLQTSIFNHLSNNFILSEDCSSCFATVRMSSRTVFNACKLTSEYDDEEVLFDNNSELFDSNCFKPNRDKRFE